MKAFRHSVVSASVAPGAQARGLAALEAAGVRIRELEHQLTARDQRIAELEDDGGLIEDVAGQFAALVAGLDDLFGVQYFPLGLRLQIEALGILLGLERPW